MIRRRKAGLLALMALAWPCTAAHAGEDGATAYNTHCRTCHSIRPGDHRLGPSLAGIFGAPAGQAEGYRGYSGAFDGLVWDEATLDKLLADPASVSSSTNMIFPPVSDPAKRRQIIEFLKSIKGN
ncbi:MAG: cytochrome c family protein [Hyphomicrobium sp.]|uniref:c-type cytochrome n=1 Tax=Hyphomicrobium sp. TaxID=82 RepID=UPI003D0E6BE6